MANQLTDQGLDLIFREAQTHNAWRDEPVAEKTLHALYDLMKFGPTSANCSPARIIFVTSKAEKERLKPMLMEANQEKTMQAPVCAIIGYDIEFYERIPQLFPHFPEAKNWFVDAPEFAEQTAFRNSSLQGAYFIIAARALGLDCGAMSGFDANAVNQAYFPDGRVRVNFLCNIGHGDPAGLFPRGPRLSFDEACKIV